MIIGSISKGALVVLLAMVSLSCSTETRSPQVYFDQAVEYKKNNKIKAAVISLKNSLQVDPNFINARVMLGQIYLDIGDADSAEKEFSRAKKLVKNNEAIEIGYTHSLMLGNKYSDIVSHIKPNNNYSKDGQAELLVSLASANTKLGNIAEANEALEAAIKVSPTGKNVKLAIIEKLVSQKDFNGALKKVGDLTVELPEYARAWYVRGAIQLRLGKAEAAEKSFIKVFELTDKEQLAPLRFDASINYLKALFVQDKLSDARVKVDELKNSLGDNYFISFFDGMLLFKANEHENARLRFQIVVNKIPDFMPAHLMMGATLFALKNYEQAESYLNRFINRIPTHIQARKLLAATRMRQHRPTDAIAALSPLLKEDTKDELLLAMVGKASITSGDVIKGKQYLQKALKVSPQNVLIRKELANAYIGQGSIDQAIEELQSISGSDDRQRDIMLVVANLKKNDFVAARKLSKKLLEPSPSPFIYTLMGSVELVAGEKIAAESYFNKALEIDPNFIPALSYAAQIALENENYSEAEIALNKVLAQDSDKLSALLGMAVIAGRQSQTEKALKFVKTAKEKNPTALRPVVILTKYYIKNGQSDEALAIVNDFVIESNQSPPALVLAGRVQMQYGKAENALRTFKKLQSAQPKLASTYIELSKAYVLLQQFEDAKKSLKTALNLQSKNVAAKVALAMLELQSKKYITASKLAKQLITENKDTSIGYRVMGDIYIAQNKISKAIEEYKKGIKREQNREIIMRLAIAYEKNQKLQESVKLLSTWLKTRPEEIEVMLLLAQTQQRTGDFPGAIKSFQSVLAVRSEHVPSMNNLAWLYFQSKDPNALDLAKNTYKLAPENGAVADTYGWILLNSSDDSALALKVLKKANDLIVDSVEIQYHLAVAHHKAGESDTARTILKKLINTGTKFADLKSAKALLSKL